MREEEKYWKSPEFTTTPPLQLKQKQIIQNTPRCSRTKNSLTKLMLRWNASHWEQEDDSQVALSQSWVLCLCCRARSLNHYLALTLTSLVLVSLENINYDNALLSTASKRVLILRTWGVPKMALGVPKSTTFQYKYPVYLYWKVVLEFWSVYLYWKVVL